MEIEPPKELQPELTPKPKKSEFEGITKIQGSILIALILIGSGAPFWSFFKPIPKWEYTLIAPSDSTFTEELNARGAEGWEVVATRRAFASDNSNIYECILKRAKR